MLTDQYLIDELKADQERQAIIARQDVKYLLEQPEFRRLLARLLAECGSHQAGFIKDPNELYFRDGKRFIGAWLEIEMKQWPDQYINFLRELTL